MRASRLAFLLVPCLLGATELVQSDARGVVLGVRAAPRPDLFVVAERALAPSGPTVLVGVPQTGAVRLEVIPGPPVAVDRALRVIPRWTDRAVPAGVLPDSFFPVARARLDDVSRLRDLRVARVTLSPYAYNPARRELIWYPELRVRVLFDGTPVATLNPAGSFESQLAALVVNYQTCRTWRALPARAGRNFFAGQRPWVKLTVDAAGIYQVSGKSLSALGIDLATIDPQTLALYTVGPHAMNGPYPDTMVPVPITVAGGGTRLGSNDYLLFYGRPASDWDYVHERFLMNPFTRGNCYWLTWGQGPGRRMAQVSGAVGDPAAQRIDHTTGLRHCEPERENPGRAGVLWIWLGLYNYPPLNVASDTLSFPQGESLTSLTVRCYPITRANVVDLVLNDEPIGTLAFTDSTELQDPTPSDSALPVNRPLVSGPNRLEFRVHGVDTARAIFVDYLEARYRQAFRLDQGALEIWQRTPGTWQFVVRSVRRTPLVFDLHDPDAPQLITAFTSAGDSLRFEQTVSDYGRYYLADPTHYRAPRTIELRTPGGLKAASEIPHYVIIAPDPLVDASRLIADYRRGAIAGISQARTAVASLSQVYDEFTFGIEEPWAIKGYLAWLFNQRRAPDEASYALLVGDGFYDYRQVKRPITIPTLPPFEEGRSLDPNVYESRAAAYDSWYADFDGAGSQLDIKLGRVTARTTAEVRRFYDKLVSYEQQSFGSWARRSVLCADDMFKGSPSLPDVGDFHIRDCENVVRITPELDHVKVYLSEYPLVNGLKPAARDALLRELTRGGLLFSFFGHGRGDLITHEQVLTYGDLFRIHNESRLPVYFFGSCGVGRFEDDRSECLAEELVRMPAGGIGAIGATKATAIGENSDFDTIFVRTVVTDGRPIGDGFYNAFNGVQFPYLRSYCLFGDPTMQLLPAPPLAGAEIHPDTFLPGRPGEFVGRTGLGGGFVATTARGPELLRRYNWVENSRIESTTYPLPGSEFYRGLSAAAGDSCRVTWTVPTGLPRDTIRVTDGYYAPDTGRCRLLAYAWSGTRTASGTIDLIPLGPEPQAAGGDRDGPTVELFADGQRLRTDTVNVVPTSLRLSGRLSDSSGILIADLPDLKPGFSFHFQSMPGLSYDLGESFSFDQGSYQRGSFNYALTMDSTASDTIVFFAYDNLQNPTVLRLPVRSENPRLALGSCLVYPSPAAGPAHFTFVLSKPARVQVRIYTVTGRLIRVLNAVDAARGYNQVRWDGLDERGAVPANGVYLYRLQATYAGTDVGAGEEDADYTGTFLVLR